MMTIKSPLRYPGGKSKAIKHIVPYFPTGITEMVSPFCGGLSIELEMSSSGTFVKCYDGFEDLITFWQVLQKRSNALYENVKNKYFPLSKERFYQLQKYCPKSKLEKASIFYALNRSSFSGVTRSGGMSPNHPRFTMKGIESLKDFNFYGEFQVSDFSESIPQNKDMFMYLDPPYMIESSNLYGVNGNHHKKFNHSQLREVLEDCHSWVLSYNDCSKIRRMYSKYRVVELSWTYGMGKSKESSEILIIKD